MYAKTAKIKKMAATDTKTVSLGINGRSTFLTPSKNELNFSPKSVPDPGPTSGNFSIVNLIKVKV